MIESRLLDFDDVILLSMNEKIVPGDNYVPTFILYPLRKYFDYLRPINEKLFKHTMFIVVFNEQKMLIYFIQNMLVTKKMI